MTLSHTQEALLAQFRHYLEETSPPPDNDASPQPVDLYSFFGELAALKNEVRIESRQIKTALDQFRGLVEPLQTGHAALQREVERQRNDQQTASRNILRPVLLELLEIRDRLVAGLEINLIPRKLLKRIFRKEQEVLDLWKEGQRMTLKRLDQTLANYEVRPIEVLDRPLDPKLARATRVEQRKGVKNGVVLMELRKGFFWHDDLLRPAEVVVNKIEEYS